MVDVPSDESESEEEELDEDSELLYVARAVTWCHVSTLASMLGVVNIHTHIPYLCLSQQAYETSRSVACAPRRVGRRCSFVCIGSLDSLFFSFAPEEEEDDDNDDDGAAGTTRATAARLSLV